MLLFFILSNYLMSLNSEYKIAVIGAGGLGVTACLGLIELFGNSIEIKIFDFDNIETSNLNRQIYFTINDIGKNKAETLSKKLNSRHPRLKKISHSNKKITKENININLNEFDVIFDCTDSAKASFLLNDFCVRNLKYFSYAGVVADYGQTLFFNPNTDSPCLRCLFENWSEQDNDKIEETCQNQGVIGPVAGLLGYMQAESAYHCIKENDSQFLRYKKEEREIILRQNRNCSCYKEIVNIDLSSKNCPQTFILSKLAIEKLNSKQKVIFAFSSAQNAKKTSISLKDENIKVNRFSQSKLLAISN